MENLITTLISLLLIAGITFVVYMLYRSRKPHDTKAHTPLNKFFPSDPAAAPKPESDYILHYNNVENIDDTWNDIALKVFISDKDGNNMTESNIYKDNALSNNFVTIGRGPKNTYQIGSKYIDSDSALFLAKRKEQGFIVKAKPNSKNGIRRDYYSDEKITGNIEFTDELTIYMGPVKIRFVSVYNKSSAQHNNFGFDRASIFGTV
jgi:hypothetical protein